MAWVREGEGDVSYCRWSCMNGMCDLYVYESDAGFETHVATRRLVEEPPECPMELILHGQYEAYAEAYQRRNAWMDERGDAAYVPIGLPYDGKSFCDPTPAACADRLRSLRAAGYNVPDYALEDLDEDAAKDATQPAPEPRTDAKRSRDSL